MLAYMKIVFAGTPEFAVASLEQLMQSHHDVLAVYTQPDRPAGRGRQLKPSAVKVRAQAYDLPVYQPASLKNTEVQAQLQHFNADVIAVVAYGLMIPDAVLTMAPHGCINVHPSLLPRWRGAAPLQRTILAGDAQTGVATMQLDSGMDTGPIYLLEKTTVQPFETSGQLHDRLAVVGARLLLRTLDKIETENLQPTPQSTEGVTHANKITKEEAQLDWSKPALVLQHAVCGFNPVPIAYTFYKNDRLRIWQAQKVAGHFSAVPGTIIHAAKEGIDVATGEGVLRLLTVQLPGGKPLSAAEFLNREQGLTSGVVLGAIDEK